MKFFSSLEKKLLDLVPKKLRNSQIFFFALLLLMLPVTILFAQQFQGENMQRIASESVTPLTPVGPTATTIPTATSTQTPTPTPISTPTPTVISTPTPTASCSPGKLTNYNLQNRCFFGGYNSVRITCNDGFTTTLRFNSCQSANSLYQAGVNNCAKRCAGGQNPTTTPTIKPTSIPTSSPTQTAGVNCSAVGNGVFASFKIISCFGKTSNACKTYDFNKDGKIDTGDYNLYLRSCSR